MGEYSVQATLSAAVGPFLDAFQQAEQAVTSFGRRLASNSSAMQKAGLAISASAGVMALGYVKGVGTMVKASADYESAFAGVRKTVNASEAEFRQIELAIKDVAATTGTSFEELSKIAEVAGQLGVAKENIIQFTDVVAKLGVATDMIGEDAATNIARFFAILGKDTKEVENLGNAIVYLGNNFAATESEIMTLAMRLAAVGKQTGMTEADILALAAVMKEVGIEAEAGGTAMTNTLNKIDNAVQSNSEELQTWASIAGMSSEQFKQAFEDDALGALIAFLAGLSEFEKQGGNVNDILDELGIKGIREVDTLKRLLGSTDKLTEAQKKANQEYKNGSALTEEAEKRYATFENQVKATKESLRTFAANVGGTVKDALGKLLSILKPVVDGIRKLSEAFIDSEGNVSKLGKVVGNIVIVIGVMLGALAIFGVVIGVVGTALGFVAGAIGTTVGALIILGIKIAAIAGIIAGVIIAIVQFKDEIIGAFKDIVKGSEELTKAWEKIKETFNKIKEAFKSGGLKEGFKTLISELGTLGEAFATLGKAVFESFKAAVLAKLEELKTTIPQKILEIGNMIKEKLLLALQTLPDKIMSFFQKAFQSDLLSSSIESFLNFGIDILNKIIEGMQSALPAIIEIAPAIIEYLVLGILAIAGMLLYAGVLIVYKLVEAIIANLPEIFMLGVKLVQTLITGIGSMIVMVFTIGLQIIWDFVSGITLGFVNVLAAGLQTFANWYNGVRLNIAQAIQSGEETVNNFIAGILPGLAYVLVTGLETFMNWYNGVRQNIAEAITTGEDTVNNFIDGIISKIGEVLQSGVDTVNSAIDGLKSGISGAFSVGSDLIAGFVDGINAGVDWVISAAQNVASQAIAAAKAVFEIGSPSKVFKQIGAWNSEGLAIGIKAAGYKAVDATQNLAQKLMGAFDSNLNFDIQDKLNQIQSVLRSSMNTDIHSVVSAEGQSLTINLGLGNSEYTAFVQDVTKEQNRIDMRRRKWDL